MTCSHRAHAGSRARTLQTVFDYAMRCGWSVSASPWQLADFISRLDEPGEEQGFDERPRVQPGSRLLVMDLESRETFPVTLVMPGKADPQRGKVSVFSPLGMALIGRRKGQFAEAEFLRFRMPLVIVDIAQADQEVEL